MSILFKNADILLTQNNTVEYLKNAYLGVTDNKIDYIGETLPQKTYDTVKDMYNKMLLPGLVNSHTHAAMTLLKGKGSELPLMDWLHLIWPIEDSMTDKDFINGTNMAILEMLACGTTSFTDMYFRPLIVAEHIGKSGIKANITRVVMGGDAKTDYKNFVNRKESLELYKTYNNSFDGRILVDWSVHAEYTIDHKIMQKWSDEINSLGGRLHTHLSETKDEFENCISQYGKTPAQLYADMGLFNIHTNAAHCVWMTEDDLEILKKYKVTVVNNPSSNLKLRSGVAKIDRMHEKGIQVALGTDGSASNNNLNMFEEMHIAALVNKGLAAKENTITTKDIFNMATINGNNSQGRDDCGSIKVGAKADIIAIDLDKPHLMPNIDALSLLIYSAQGSDVCMTMVDGKILYENGEYFTMDKEKIFDSVKESLKNLKLQ